MTSRAPCSGLSDPTFLAESFSAALMHASQARLDAQEFDEVTTSLQRQAFRDARQQRGKHRQAPFGTQVLAITRRLLHAVRKDFALGLLPICIAVFMSTMVCIAYFGIGHELHADLSGRRNAMFVSLHLAAFYHGPLMLSYMSERDRTNREIINGWYSVGANVVAWCFVVALVAMATSLVQCITLKFVLDLGVPFSAMLSMVFLTSFMILAMSLAIASLPLPRADTIVIVVISSVLTAGACSGALLAVSAWCRRAITTKVCRRHYSPPQHAGHPA